MATPIVHVSIEPAPIGYFEPAPIVHVSIEPAPVVQGSIEPAPVVHVSFVYVHNAKPFVCVTIEPLGPVPTTPADFAKLSRKKLIGEGSFGKVYQLSDPRYVLKVFKDVDDMGLDSYNMREIASFRKLDKTPYMMRCSSVSDAHNIYMPAYTSDLRKFLGRSRRDPGRIRRFMHQLISGVYGMHQIGITHRDLKPDNILVGDELVISDFGASRFGIDDIMPITGDDVCTRWYRAPEILLGDCKYDAAVDMWSLGIIMAEMLDRVPVIGPDEVCTDPHPGGRGKCELFEGDSAIDQIYKCFQLFGTPTNATWSGVETLRHYKSTFPKWDPQPLTKYFKADADALDLLSRLLTLDPHKRITAKEAIHHKYFHAFGPPASVSMRHEESGINPNYMSKQGDLNPRMRTVLVDWLIEVTYRFKIHHMTFFLAVNYLDHFLMLNEVNRNKLQLVGITCLMIASKIIEVHMAGVDDFVSVCDKAYKRDEIVKMESVILRTLDYNLYRTTEYTYMVWNTGTLERDTILKKLYIAVLDLRYRELKWAELMRADIKPEPNNTYRAYQKMHAKIDCT